MIAPVVLFVYNRLDHTMNVIESLQKNLLADKTDLYVFSDAAKNEGAKKAVQDVREYIHREDWRKSFQSVSIIEAEKNKGLANSIIGGVTDIINQYHRVIVVEDDLILSPYFLTYMNEALDYYQNDQKIWSISGYSFPMKSLEKYDHDVFYSYRGCSWGWATWSDRWALVDWDVKDYSKMINDKAWKEKFNRGGSDLSGMLTRQMEGKSDSWAIRWCFSQSNHDMYTIYPSKSYVLNEGCDGSGTHCGDDGEYDTDIYGCKKNCKFEKLGIDKKITREFWYKYSDTLDKKIKRNLLKYKSFISYGIFGVFTTVVNILTYNVCYNSLGLGNTISNIIAWILAVTFAYLTNKSWVFESKSWEWKILRKEIPAFVSCRIATGVLDIIIMYICVDIMKWPAMLMKLASNVIVIVLNYIFSKLVIFRKTER